MRHEVAELSNACYMHFDCYLPASPEFMGESYFPLEFPIGNSDGVPIVDSSCAFILAGTMKMGPGLLAYLRTE